MSKMQDRWGDTIEVTTVAGLIFIDFRERVADMELDAALARTLIKKLKKAIAEVEDE